MTRLGEFSARTTDGREVPLSEYDGRVVLVVNTASQCGYTGQLAGLQQLHERYADRGFSVLGFPSNQFRQEPLADEEMGQLCERYSVTFPVFGKVDVNGSDAHPLFQWLKDEQKGVLGGRIKWNFTKFLVDRQGRVVGRYAPTTEPATLADDVEKALAE